MLKNEKIKLKAKVLFEYEYEVESIHYQKWDNLTTKDIIKSENEYAQDDLCMFLEMCNTDPKIEITEVKGE